MTRSSFGARRSARSAAASSRSAPLGQVLLLRGLGEAEPRRPWGLPSRVAAQGASYRTGFAIAAMQRASCEASASVLPHSFCSAFRPQESVVRTFGRDRAASHHSVGVFALGFAAVSWSVSGTYLESCNCDAICPCRKIDGVPGGRSTHGICLGALSWFVEDGQADDIELSRFAVALVCRYDDDEPGSPWTISLHVDDTAPPRHRLRWPTSSSDGAAATGSSGCPGTASRASCAVSARAGSSSITSASGGSSGSPTGCSCASRGRSRPTRRSRA